MSETSGGANLGTGGSAGGRSGSGQGSGQSSGQGGGSDGGRRRGGLFDDLAGLAGGAFSALAGMRNEAEAMARSQADQMIQRLDLVRREELDAALEVARRARDQAEALAVRVTALEARLAPAPSGETAEQSASVAPDATSAAGPATLPIAADDSAVPLATGPV